MIDNGTWLARLNKPWVVALLLFAVALIPRAVAAGAYVTVDEQRWIERGVDFMYNLRYGDPATIVSLHPGVTATWGFGLALVTRFLLAGDLPTLWQMRADNFYDLPDLLPTAAIFTVLVTALTVVGGYLLLRKLADGQIAFLAALILALDPIFLAHSRRVHVDALLASFMVLSALALLVYVSRPDSPPPRRYLVFSGVMAGLAWLTKLPALFLIPYTLLALAGRYLLTVKGLRLDGQALWRETKSFLLWLATAGLVFYVLWPSMWVQPRFVLSELARVSLWGMDQPHRSPATVDAAAMQFFMGRAVDDPGAGYYPLISLFRMSPVTFLFLPLGLIAIVAGQRHKTVPRAKALAYWLGVAYVVFFVIMLSLGAKKLESYVLPIFPMVDVLAAVGLMAALRWLAGWWQRRRNRSKPLASLAMLYSLAVVLIILTSFLWLRLAPYYSAYFNPLLGGAPLATRLFVFGGGEGLAMAADYVNGKENAQDLVVATPYHDSVFRYYFQGSAVPAGGRRWPGSWLTADYVIGYFSYTQRNLPAPEVVEFLKTLEPEYVANINGIDYARVYKVPALVTDTIPPITHPAGVNLGDKLTFLGYDLDMAQVESGGRIELALYWQRRQPLDANYSVYLRLINGVGHVWGQQDSGPLQGMMPTSFWGEETVIADVRRLQILPGTPPGAYLIEMGVYDSATMQHLEPVGPEEEIHLGSVEIVRATAGEPPSPQHRLEVTLDHQVRLLGYDLGGQFKPGGALHLTLFWEALSTPDKAYTVFVHLVGPDGQIWGQQDSQPVTGYYPTSRWVAGEFVRDQYDLTIRGEAPPGSYTLVVGMYDASSSQRLPVLDEKGTIIGDSVDLGAFQLEQP